MQTTNIAFDIKTVFNQTNNDLPKKESQKRTNPTAQHRNQFFRNQIILTSNDNEFTNYK